MRPWRINLHLIVLAAATALAASTAPAASAGARAADRIRTKAGIGYSGEIVGVAEAGVVIRVGGSKRTVPFADIRDVEATDYPDLKRAEAAYAEGVGGKAEGFRVAEELYRRILRRKAPPWLRVLAQFRMYRLYVASGSVAEALDGYLEMARSGPKMVAGLKLPSPAEGDHNANLAMLKKVERVLEKAGNKPYADALKSFHVALLLLEGNPERILPLLEPLLASRDTNVRTSAMLRRIELLLATGRVEEAAEGLGRVEAAIGDDGAAEMAYWRGRVHQAKGNHALAALEYMRLPILHPTRDRNRTADALWRAGKTMEDIRAPREEILGIYNEAVNQYAGTAGAERAKRELARLGST